MSGKELAGAPAVSRAMMRRLRVLFGISALTGILLFVLAWGTWVTMAAATGLVIGSVAGLAGRTWGVVLALASAIAIAVVPFLGIAPWWFLLVGTAGLAPVATSTPSLLRADRAAASVLLVTALAAGLTSAASARQGWAFEAADLIEQAVVAPFATAQPATKGAHEIQPAWSCSHADSIY